MKFRTEVEIPLSEQKIGTDDRLFSIGSCFASELSSLLSEGQLQTLNNPFGTLFNPFSINQALKKLHSSEFYTEDDLIKYNDEIISLDHHSSFNSRFLHQTLEKINKNIEVGNQFLQTTKWVIITYGSSFIYEFLPKNKLVANCHKIPAKHFEKRLLSQNEISESISETIKLLKDICLSDMRILFTVSPVRHTRDGMTENLHSKSKIITALHEVIPQFENCYYLPVYEILMDDLRDYRFYKDDLIHPNSQAIRYIWEKFMTAYFADETRDFVDENLRIIKALAHKSADEQSPKHQEFSASVQARILAQRAKVKHQIFRNKP